MYKQSLSELIVVDWSLTSLANEVLPNVLPNAVISPPLGGASVPIIKVNGSR
jgi:hypothetical protein